MGWREEFSADFDVPSFIEKLVKAEVLDDISWHNDVCPSFGVSVDSAAFLVRLWVEHPILEQRESGMKRFCVDVSVDGAAEEGFEYHELEEALLKFVELAKDPRLAGTALHDRVWWDSTAKSWELLQDLLKE